MPEALKIVPPIIEEVCEEEKDGDAMEVDSGNGRNGGDTLAAGVQCLLQCLNPATAESSEGQHHPFASFGCASRGDAFSVRAC